MTSSICTLFEGNYHYGIAALVNSLHNYGFKGPVYAGYRGNLPDWCAAAKVNESIDWPGAKTFEIPTGVTLHFLPLGTENHFTNYKPDFMLELLAGPAKDTKYIFYFDPDIVLAARWSSFEEWVNCGIALCEDVNSPLSENHPRRIAWRNFYGERGLKLSFKEGIYANGGFVGLRADKAEFLKLWKHIQEEMAPQIGGLCKSSLIGPKIPEKEAGPFSPFGKTDQDALNAAVEAWNDKVSFVGKEAMGFASGLALMPHALGHPKPWRWKPIMKAISGQPPRLVDREYWNNVNTHISTHSSRLVAHRKMCINIAAFIGRFYKRGANGGAY